MKKDNQNKYYTPSSEEFHIGFEYELLVPDKLGKDAKEEWKTQQVTPYFFHDIIKGGFITLIKEGKIRVKYLDKEDIESLGFEFFNSNIYKQPVYIKKNQLEISNKLIQSDIIQVNEHEYYIKNSKNSFNGIIKNKSELQKLLKQLNIL